MYNLLDVAPSPPHYAMYYPFAGFFIPLLFIGLTLLTTVVIVFIVAHKKKQHRKEKEKEKNDKEIK